MTGPRTAADLSARDIGQMLTLTGPDWSITGPLRRISTDTDWVSDQAMQDAEPTLTPGNVTTTITVGRWTASFTSPAAIGVRTETNPEVREP